VLNIKPGENDILKPNISVSWHSEKKTSSDQRTSSLEAYKEQILVMLRPRFAYQLIDGRNRPTFNTGHAELLPHTRNILRELGAAINDRVSYQYSGIRILCLMAIMNAAIARELSADRPMQHAGK